MLEELVMVLRLEMAVRSVWLHCCRMRKLLVGLVELEGTSVASMGLALT